ncbi:hypothetical protein B296_00038166 [Ensete ventricosum]|uniref:Phytocyanin domain-containing protein n=1 Tax=Ensete ventricosum TaxID=4639 RepID=A0A426ZER9_ENSVE|nr:hypothetical protein B296_00038166 [Ensete ventricosum]
MAASSKSLSPFCVALLLLASILGSLEKQETLLVGGSDNAWRVTPNTTDSLNQWAEKNRFRVTRDAAYPGCNRSSPVAEHKDGATVVRLQPPGSILLHRGKDGRRRR